MSSAAQLRGNRASADLAEAQAEWVVGRNPFAASIMYGEGYNWEPLYSVRSGQIVGALPVGIETRGFNDTPYWPHQICWTYKEVWTHPVGRWLWLMEDIAGPAVLEGVAAAGAHQSVVLREAKTGATMSIPIDIATGAFRASLPEGDYIVTQGGQSQTLAVLPGGHYYLSLLPSQAMSFTLSYTSEGEDVTIKLAGEGAGKHTFAIRADNLAGRLDAQEVTLASTAKTLTWRLRVTAPDQPWTLVVIPDKNMTARKELTGVIVPGKG